jgi:hypothetical protein
VRTLGAGAAFDATLVREIANQIVHGGEICAVKELASLPHLLMSQRLVAPAKVERERRRGKSDALPHNTRWQPFRPLLNEQSVDSESMFVRQAPTTERQQGISYLKRYYMEYRIVKYTISGR